jgi:hypothetical protein
MPAQPTEQSQPALAFPLYSAAKWAQGASGAHLLASPPSEWSPLVGEFPTKIPLPTRALLSTSNPLLPHAHPVTSVPATAAAEPLRLHACPRAALSP